MVFIIYVSGLIIAFLSFLEHKQNKRYYCLHKNYSEDEYRKKPDKNIFITERKWRFSGSRTEAVGSSDKKCHSCVKKRTLCVPGLKKNYFTQI